MRTKISSFYTRILIFKKNLYTGPQYEYYAEEHDEDQDELFLYEDSDF